MCDSHKFVAIKRNIKPFVSLCWDEVCIQMVNRWEYFGFGKSLFCRASHFGCTTVCVLLENFRNTIFVAILHVKWKEKAWNFLLIIINSILLNANTWKLAQTIIIVPILFLLVLLKTKICFFKKNVVFFSNQFTQIICINKPKHGFWLNFPKKKWT